MNALSKIQQALKAPKGQTNNFGKYKYRSCEDILEAIKPLLGDCTLTLSDEMVEVGGRVYVKATANFWENAGKSIIVYGWAREAEDKKGMDAAQITGAASSYARKYALNGLFCIDDTKDADATNDHGKGNTSVKKAVSLKMITKQQTENLLALKSQAELTDERFKTGIEKVANNPSAKLADLNSAQAATFIKQITTIIKANAAERRMEQEDPLQGIIHENAGDRD